MHPNAEQTAGGTIGTWNPPAGTCIGFTDATLIVETAGGGAPALNFETGNPPLSVFSGLTYADDVEGVEECFVGTAKLVYAGFVVAFAQDNSCG